MSEDTQILNVSNLHKSFGGKNKSVHALKGATLKVNRNEFVAIMGPSGCGKSTLLHLIAGLAKPDSGSIEIEKKNICTMSNHCATLFRRERIGFIFQDFNLIPTLTAKENILLGQLLGAKTQNHIDKLLDSLGIAGLKDQWPAYLSGGECQRIAIARALAANPALVLADEPTGSLDFENGQNLCKLLKDVQQHTHGAILLVTHETSVAQWADRVLVMKDGAIVREIMRNEFKQATDLFRIYRQALGLSEVEGAA